MKILVLQLARFGDILQTWPTLKALKRQYPQAELHCLVRKKFASALSDFDDSIVDKIWILDSQEVIKPLVEDEINSTASIKYLNLVVDALSNEKFDHLINLSFSPFSASLTYKINANHKKGYGLFADGSVNFQDAASAYFYAQVGIGKANRIHVCDLFAKVAGVELTKDDWTFNRHFDLKDNEKIESPYVVVHLGASQSKKRYPIQMWQNVISQLTDKFANQKIKIVLIGSEAEKNLSEQVCTQISSPLIVDLVGKTTLQTLAELIKNAAMFVGCDSGPLQVASLVGTKSLNLSFSSVNFWETGPKAPLSRILFWGNPNDLRPHVVVEEIVKLYFAQKSERCTAEVESPVEEYMLNGFQNDFKWNLLKLIYFNGPVFEINSDLAHVFAGVSRISEELIHNLKLLKMNPLNKQILALIQILEHKISEIKNKFGEIEELVFWFECEKRMIPPGDFNNIVTKTHTIYQKLNTIAKAMSPTEERQEEFDGNHKMDSK